MNAGTTTKRPAVAASGGGGRPDRRRWRPVLAVIVVLVTAAAAFAVAGVLKRTAAPGAGGGSAFKTSTAIVARRTLVSQTQVNATLEGAGSYSVVNQASGTLTWPGPVAWARQSSSAPPPGSCPPSARPACRLPRRSGRSDRR